MSALTIVRAVDTDDDGTGRTGTAHDNAWKMAIYDAIDAVVTGLLTTICDGRLTLTTVTPVTPADVLAATTLFFSPYKGNRIALYSGTAWLLRSFSELSIAVPATTSQMYDVFVFDSGGAPTLELLAWTNDTTRATALALQDGVLVKSGATTRRYVGSFRTTTVSGQTEDSAVKRYVWNYYNRVRRELLRQETSSATWNYTSATVRQANGSAANQVDVVVGVAEAELHLEVQVTLSNTNAAVSTGVMIGEDSTTTPVAGQAQGFMQTPAVNTLALSHATLHKYPPIGRHFSAWLEASVATGTTTWFGAGQGFGAGNVGGLYGSIEG